METENAIFWFEGWRWHLVSLPQLQVTLLARCWDHLWCASAVLWWRAQPMRHREEQPEWTASALGFLMSARFGWKGGAPTTFRTTSVSLFWRLPQHPRIRPENPQYPWNAALLSRASSSRVRLAPKTARAALREERVFWNFSDWERKSFQDLFIFVDAIKVHQVDLINFKILFSMEVKLLQVNTEWIVRFYFIFFIG